jgi:hypothetical protein
MHDNPLRHWRSGVFLMPLCASCAVFCAAFSKILNEEPFITICHTQAHPPRVAASPSVIVSVRLCEPTISHCPHKAGYSPFYGQLPDRRVTACLEAARSAHPPILQPPSSASDRMHHACTSNARCKRILDQQCPPYMHHARGPPDGQVSGRTRRFSSSGHIMAVDTEIDQGPRFVASGLPRRLGGLWRVQIPPAIQPGSGGCMHVQ